MPDALHARLHLPILLLAALAACGGPEAPVEAGEGAGDGSGPTFRYAREYTFVGMRADTPFVVPFAFRATPAGESLDREARAWLGRGASWEQFLDESYTNAASSGVWRVLPRGSLGLAAGGPTEVEALWFRQGSRRLRLDLGAPLTEWTQGEDVRYRVDQARLTLGEESMPGVALEMLRVERADDDGASDALVVASGDSLRLLVAEAMDGEGEGRGVAWMRGPEGDRAWDVAEVRWMEVEPYEEARRDIPVRWTFRVPQAGLYGQVESMGYTVVLGEERAGRRALEARYTVRGWVQRDGQVTRSKVTGMLRHQQR